MRVPLPDSDRVVNIYFRYGYKGNRIKRTEAVVQVRGGWNDTITGQSLVHPTDYAVFDIEKSRRLALDRALTQAPLSRAQRAAVWFAFNQRKFHDAAIRRQRSAAEQAKAHAEDQVNQAIYEDISAERAKNYMLAHSPSDTANYAAVGRRENEDLDIPF